MPLRTQHILYTCMHSVHTTKVNYTKLTYLVSRTAIPFSVHSVTFSDSTLGILCSVFSWYIPALKIDTFYIFFPLWNINEIIVLLFFAFSILSKSVVWTNFRFDKIIVESHFCSVLSENEYNVFFSIVWWLTGDISIHIVNWSGWRVNTWICEFTRTLTENG